MFVNSPILRLTIFSRQPCSSGMSIHASYMALPNPMIPLIERLQEKTFVDVSMAGRNEDADRLSVLNGRIQELERLKRNSSECWRKLCQLEDMIVGENARPQAPQVPREIRVTVTKSNLDNAMLLLTAQVKARLLKLGEKMRIETPQQRLIETEVVGAPARLKARKAIREFFTANRIQAGDCVRLSQIEDGGWRMEKG